jgi:hypothetical protein
MQEYESALEEEAIPFEERAIAVHEKNLELMASGVYNPWIDKSLAKLAELMPGRYAKVEASSGWIASVDSYAYRAPKTPAVPDPAQIAEPAPETVGGAADATEFVEPAPAAAAEESEAVEVAPDVPAAAADEAEDALAGKVSDANPR